MVITEKPRNPYEHNAVGPCGAELRKQQSFTSSEGRVVVKRDHAGNVLYFARHYDSPQTESIPSENGPITVNNALSTYFEKQPDGSVEYGIRTADGALFICRVNRDGKVIIQS